MTSLDNFLHKAVAAGPERAIAGCVLAVCKDDVIHHKSFGTESVDPSSPRSDMPMSLDTTMWIASCTKLMTAVAALQCIEKGFLNLDDDVSKVLTDRAQLSVLVGFDATGEPILEGAKETITLRMLLTHQSGLGYDFIRPELKQYVQYMEGKGKLNSKYLSEKLSTPLLFEPGSSWEYGIGTDWAGQMVEKATGQSLGAYMQQHIFQPLGMSSSTFHLQERPDIKDRRADMSMREDDGKLVPSNTRFLSDDEPSDLGGGGLFSSPADYLKFLAALLRDDGTLLRSDSVDTLFKPCLSPLAAKKFQTTRTDQYRTLDNGQMAIPAPEFVDYALGGMVTMRDVPGGRKSGAMSWGGLPNLSWVIDRDTGLALFYASQLLPPGDKETQRIVRGLEAAVYSGEFFEGALRT